MRIQHNITAMNSYRNLSSNQSRLNKNLEKLSTGYKVNRASDDAAGLAISEKMRAQISGLEQATKNAKDGMSLIQTAEGALTEVHDMLNRMVTLAEQSANGTYDDTVDRFQLQKEVEALKSEIDRVAESTNYNGIKLLDGSLSGAGSLKGNVNTNDTQATAASATIGTFTALATASGKLPGKQGDKIEFTMSWTGADKTQYTRTVSFTVSEDEKSLIASDGTQYRSAAGTAKEFTDADIAKAVQSELQKDSEVSNAFDVTRVQTSGTASSTDTVNNTLKFESKVKGTGGAQLNSVDAKHIAAEDGKISQLAAKEITHTKAKDTMQKIDLGNLKVLTKSAVVNSGDTEKAVNDNTFSVDGKKFVLIGACEDYKDFKQWVDSDTTIIKMDVQKGSTASTAMLTDVNSSFNGGANAAFTMGTENASADYKKIAAELSRVTGRDFSVQEATVNTTDVEAKAGIQRYDILLASSKLTKGGKSLMLQVGDTSDDFNRVGVTVGDMHVNALGLRDVDISNQDGAASAVSVIKAAVNQVSDTRGGLGALQNRLDHTINNLGVMRENIQSAESLIRDTDVAEEMMTYTKNNILNQSAQAMLAQANQLPQGVLQLLG